jgi:hypothetical protein
MAETLNPEQLQEVKVGPEVKEIGEITEVIKDEFHNIKGVNTYVEDLAEKYDVTAETATYSKVYLTLKHLNDAQMVPPEFSKLAFEVVGYARKDMSKGIRLTAADSEGTEEEQLEKFSRRKVNESDFYVTMQLLYKGYMPEDIQSLEVNAKAMLLRNVGRPETPPPSKTTSYAQEATMLNPDLSDNDVYDKYVTTMNEVVQVLGRTEDIDKLSPTEKVQKFGQSLSLLEQSGVISDQTLFADFKLCEDVAFIGAKKQEVAEVHQRRMAMSDAVVEAESAAVNMFRKAIPESVLSTEDMNKMTLLELKQALKNYNDSKRKESVSSS